MMHRAPFAVRTTLALCCAALCPSCGKVRTDSTEQAAAPAATYVELEPGCSALDLGRQTGLLADGPIERTTSDDNPGVCNGGTADASYRWQAPSSGCYWIFNDTGTTKHTLTVRSNSCSGGSISCTLGDSYGTGVSLIAQADQVFVIQTSFRPSTDTSDFWLRIERCDP